MATWTGTANADTWPPGGTDSSGNDSLSGLPQEEGRWRGPGEDHHLRLRGGLSRGGRSSAACLPRAGADAQPGGEAKGERTAERMRPIPSMG